MFFYCFHWAFSYQYLRTAEHHRMSEVLEAWQETSDCTALETWLSGRLSPHEGNSNTALLVKEEFCKLPTNWSKHPNVGMMWRDWDSAASMISDNSVITNRKVEREKELRAKPEEKDTEEMLRVVGWGWHQARGKGRMLTGREEKSGQKMMPQVVSVGWAVSGVNLPQGDWERRFID